MTDAIEQARRAAAKFTNATPDDIERGLALHQRIVACDLFGFLPVTLSVRAYKRLEAMIEGGASYEEIRPVRELLYRQSAVYDPECRSQFDAIIDQTGLNAMMMTVGSEKSLHHSLHRLSWYVEMLDRMSDRLRKVAVFSDIALAREEGKLAVIFAANSSPAESGLSDGQDAHQWIDIFHRFGVRAMHLTYNRRNWVGDGCLEPADGGLSVHGRDVIRHLNDVGILIDTAHTGRQSTLDAAKASRTPIIASHTSCRAVYDHPRGKTDDELRAIADGGGVIGICAIPSFLGPTASIRNLLDHIDHAVQLVGSAHVAIGTDQAYCGPEPEGLPSLEDRYPRASKDSPDRWFGGWQPEHQAGRPSPEQRASLAWTNWPYITVGLVARGYKEEDIANIMGGNVLRVMETVWNAGESPA